MLSHPLPPSLGLILQGSYVVLLKLLSSIEGVLTLAHIGGSLDVWRGGILGDLPLDRRRSADTCTGHERDKSCFDRRSSHETCLARLWGVQSREARLLNGRCIHDASGASMGRPHSETMIWLRVTLMTF